MQIKGKYTWLKHLDFMLVDLFSLLLAFAISYRIKFGSFEFTDTWMPFILIVSLLNLIISFFINPYSGIFRRSYYKEIKKSLLLTGYNLVLSIVIFYLFKVGETYSRELTVGMYAAYFIISVILKYVWKKLLLSGKVVIYSTKSIPLFIIGNQNNIGKVIRNVSSGDFQLYDIKGVHLVKNTNTPSSAKHSQYSQCEVAETFHNKANNKATDDTASGISESSGELNTLSIPIVADDYLDYILDNNILEVLIAVEPSSAPAGFYEKLIANGVGVNMMIEDVIGFQTEDQYIQNIGVYRTLIVVPIKYL